MTHEKEMELVRELGRLQKAYSLVDESEENKAMAERIKEIREVLNLHSEPRKNRRPSRLAWR